MPDEPIVVVAGSGDAPPEPVATAEHDAMALGRELEQLHGRDSEIADELSKHRFSDDDHPRQSLEESEAWTSLRSELSETRAELSSLRESVSSLLPPPPQPIAASDEVADAVKEQLENLDEAAAVVPSAPISVEVPAPSLNPSGSSKRRRGLVRRLRKRG